MTVLLIHLPVGFEEAYPLGLASLAGPLIDGGHTVKGIDLGRVGMDELKHQLSSHHVTVVGLGVWTPSLHQAQEVVAAVRRFSPQTTVVVGGPHVTLRPNDIEADYAVVGEGEVVFSKLVNTLVAGENSSQIPGIHVPGSSAAITTAEPVDLNALPITDRTVFAVDDYHRDHLPQTKRFASVVTSRGCSFDCSFCSTPAIYGRKHRYFSAERVVEEWARLSVDHGVDGLLVEDDLFTLNRSRVSDLCDMLIKHPPGVTWELLNGVRPDSLDPALVHHMARAGCRRLAVGIETSAHDQLKAMGRSLDVLHLKTVLKAALDAGMSTTGYFMLGLPGETVSDRKKTFELACNLPLDMAHFSQASAWPGTHWSRGDLVDVPKSERAQYYAGYYLHPKRAWRVAKALNIKISQLPDMVMRLGRWMTQPLEERRSNL